MQRALPRQIRDAPRQGPVQRDMPSPSPLCHRIGYGISVSGCLKSFRSRLESWRRRAQAKTAPRIPSLHLAPLDLRAFFMAALTNEYVITDPTAIAPCSALVSFRRDRRSDGQRRATALRVDDRADGSRPWQPRAPYARTRARCACTLLLVHSWPRPTEPGPPAARRP